MKLVAAKAALAELALSPSPEEMSAIDATEHSANLLPAVLEPLIKAPSRAKIAKTRIDLIQSARPVETA